MVWPDWGWNLRSTALKESTLTGVIKLNVICVCLCIVVFKTYCVVGFFVLCTLCCQFFWIFHFLLVFSNVYLLRRCILFNWFYNVIQLLCGITIILKLFWYIPFTCLTSPKKTILLITSHLFIYKSSLGSKNASSLSVSL